MTISRDEWGVPHIYGKTDADVGYGLAWAACEDNFYDIQLNLLMSRARQAEVLGKDGAIVDFAVQMLKVREMVAEKYDSDVSASFKTYLSGYSQGMNAYAAKNPKSVLRKGLFPITNQDVIAGYVMSLVLMEGVPFHLINILEGRAGQPTPFSLRGSNGFAFNSNITADGQVYLINNSHQPLDGPTAWYEAHLISDEGLNVLGGLFPGGCSVFAGTNPNIAWMHTVNLPDLVDVYQLKMHPKDKLSYKYDGEWKELETRKAKMKVKIGPIHLKVGRKSWWSIHGPVLKHKKDFFALRFPALMTIKAAEQWFMMNKANNFTEFHEALKMGGLPSLNIIYADRRDTIFYIDNGLYPMRKPGYDWLGLLPGDTSSVVWDSFHPIEDIPQILNPEAGFVFNTNNSPWNASAPQSNLKRSDFDSTLYNYPVENNRSLRVNEIMDGKETITWEEVLVMKYDRQYPDSLYVHFLANLNCIFSISENDFPEIREELTILKQWDRKSNTDNLHTALFIKTFDFLFEEAKENHLFAIATEYPESHYAEAIQKAGKYLRKYFGKIEIPLGQFQRHVRGNEDYPIGGSPDVISAMQSKTWKNGQKRSYLGDSYIQLIRFKESGVEIQSVQPYGNSNVPSSPHYDDQIPLYLKQETKEESLDMDWVKRHAKTVYHPE